MKQKAIEKVFEPIIQYMDLQQGEAFADVGASSGYFTVMMSTLLEKNTIYVQDIDTACLNDREFKKVLNYYTKQSKKPLSEMHEFKVTIGDPQQTNLPENAIDKIYTNGTFHLFTDPDLLIQDLYQKLHPTGLLFIRDNFTNSSEIKLCEDKKCAKPLTQKSQFLEIMERNKFKLEKFKEMSGYPVFAFSKVI
jgi:protein-L-isoaspartate O-methyltransferase